MNIDIGKFYTGSEPMGNKYLHDRYDGQVCGCLVILVSKFTEVNLIDEFGFLNEFWITSSTKTPTLRQ
ncbi:hypothetical protein FHG87_010908 [Trinorchestia longiramus]|nr:hypothetical protein FHG87_010908 [Trinorchestia longiramus]